MATYKDGYPLMLGPHAHTPLFHKLGLLNIFDIFKLQFKLQLGKLVFELGATGD